MTRKKHRRCQADASLDNSLLQQIVDAHAHEWLPCLDQALDAIEAALDARRVRFAKARRRAGDLPFAMGADHAARLQAVELFIKMVTMGRSTPNQTDRSDGSCTLEELQMVRVAARVNEVPAKVRDEARRKLEQMYGRPWDRSDQLPTLPAVVSTRRKRIEPVLHRAWKAMRDALAARVPLPSDTTLPVDLGPDRRIVLRAVSLLMQLVTVGRPAPKPRTPPKESIEEVCERVYTALALSSKSPKPVHEAPASVPALTERDIDLLAKGETTLCELLGLSDS